MIEAARRRLTELAARAGAAPRRLLLEERGSIAIFLTLALIPLVAAVGIGVDTARGFLVRSRLSQALDSAALAGGKVMFETYRDDDVKMYFKTNFPNGYLGATVGTPTITDDGAAKENLTVTASATLPSTFMRIFGHDTITVSATATVNRTNRGMELALVLDNTYSMASNSKMTNLKSAANQLLDILYGANNDTADNLTVGIVPFVAMVNIGNQYSSWTTPRPTGQVTITSLTRSSSSVNGSISSTSNPLTYYACATVSGTLVFRDGEMVDISGVSQSDYNGRRQIRRSSWPSSCASGTNKFWYMIDNHGSGSAVVTPATAASGQTMTAKYPPETWASGTYSSTNGVWKGCVEQRFDLTNVADPFDLINAEDSPTTRRFRKAFDASTVGARFYDTAGKFRYACTNGSSTPNNLSGGSDVCDNNWDSTHIQELGAQTAQSNNRGPNKGCAVPILPLQPSKATAKATIATMQPWNGGGTNIPIGLAWGWRVVSPNYRGLWAAPAAATAPNDYNTALMDKVVVLLSDGQNTALKGPLPACNGTTSPGYNCAPHESDYTGYGRLTSGGFNTTNINTAPDMSDQRVGTMCAEMKAKGIIIYTIMLEENDPSINAIFQGCATKPEYYFLATSGQLTTIFQKIANQLSNLRLSK